MNVLSRLRKLKEGHLPALAALGGVHFLVFSRALVTRGDGALFTHLRWDFEDSYHRFLVYISDCVHAGALPLWYPYGSAGSPFFVNPQSQMWSPVTWLVTATLGYSHHVAQRQLIFTVLVGGFGAYLLAHQIWHRRLAALFAGLCFMLTGAVYSNFQHLDIINAFALTPWLFWSLLHLSNKHWRAVPITALVFVLLLTSGYPGCVMMLALWALATVAYLCFDAKDPSARRRFLWAFIAAGALALLIGTGYWLPIALHIRSFTRGEPLSLTQALSGGIGFVHFLGLLFPFTVDAAWAGFRPDITMRGLYMGVLALPLLALCVVRRREAWVGILSGAALLALLLSAGAEFFGRVTLNLLLPFLNFSRFPSADSRALAVLFAALLAAGGAKLVLETADSTRAELGRAYRILAVALPVVAVGLKLTIYADINLAVFNDKVASSIVLQVLLLLAAWAMVRRTESGPRLLAGLAVLLALDLGSGVQNGYTTVGESLSEEEYAARSRQYVRTFSPEAAEVPRLVTGQNLNDYRATAGYIAKRFYLSDYNPFRLRTFDTLIERGFQEWLANGKRVVMLPPDRTSVADAAEFGALMTPVDYKITRYLCDRVDYKVELEREALITFNEVYFPGWKAFINGNERPLLKVAGGLRGLVVGPGTHEIRTIFAPASFKLGLALTGAGWLVFFVWTAIVLKSRKQHSRHEKR
jgi:hypothetical protein